MDPIMFSTKMCPVLSYLHIPQDHIRLLKVSGAPPKNLNSQLNFTMRAFPISEAPSYTAVSYVWGSGSASKEIQLNDQKFAIRSNLWLCLWCLSKYWYQSSQEWEYIWVDAICIDQANIEERNSQVRMMNQIYSKAVEVSAWLGLQQHPLYLSWREESKEILELDNWMAEDHVLELAERPYWTRMWIIQELLLARQIRFHVGNASFDFNHLSLLVQQRSFRHAADLQRVLAYAKARDPDTQGSWSLHDLLRDFGACRCQDPRDKVFALLSLLTNSVERSLLERFFPDYSLSHDAVVVITLSHLRDFSKVDLIAESEALFDAMDVVQSTRRRQRLLHAARYFDTFSRWDPSNEITFWEVPFYQGIFEEQVAYPAVENYPWMSWGGLYCSIM